KLLCEGSGPERIGLDQRSSFVRFTLIVSIGWVWLALGSGTAIAQPLSPHGVADASGVAQSGASDVPAGAARIRGRVVHKTDPTAAAGVPIVLYSLGPDGSPGLRGMLSAADGSFAFERIANDASIVYLVGARYREVPFGVRMSFDPAETERVVELTIAEPTTDSADARIAEVLIRVDQGCDGLLVEESHSLENNGDFVIYVPESERAGRAPVLRVPVPAGATHLESSSGDSLDWDGKTISFWGPLRPGGEDLEFTYGLPGGDGAVEFSKDFPSDVDRVRVFSHAAGPILSAPGGDARLEPGESVVLDGRSYPVLETKDLPPGTTLVVRAELRPVAAVSEAIVGEESRIWLDLDDATLTVDEQHELSVAGSKPLVSGSGTPLFCFALDAAAEQLQFSNDTLALGLSRDPSGALAVRGPFPAGPTTFSIRYRIPVASDEVAFVRNFPFDIPLLSVFVADTGLVIETRDLHRRRPIRTQDRNYLHLEAFGVDRGAPVRIGLEPVELRRPMTQWAFAGFAVVAGLLAIGFLTVPLRGAPEEAPEPLPSHYAEERQSVLASLRSLEDDFETNKLSQADYTELRQQLRASAVELLSLEREDASTERNVETAAISAPACGKCGAELDPDARFCSQCGTRAAEESPNAGSGE
ncbi:MAG: zinc ribbon domain-containing protein, partial [Myxococcota bacterium]